MALASLTDYDTALANDMGIGLFPSATLTDAVVLTGGAGVAFEFGATSGDGTIEFILEGNPGAGVSSFLAVGANSTSSLRYEVWNNTGEIGFTQGGVADYQFTPGVASPAKSTHLAYVWDAPAATMKIYINGQLAGTTIGVAASFELPTGSGWLGAKADGSEGMVGTIHRVTVYDSILTEAEITRHANAYGALVGQALLAYDNVITNDAASGLPTLSKLTTEVTLTGSSGEPFDFGLSTDDVTMEFIIAGNPALNDSAFLAVAENASSSLRYELWFNTGQMGFTQGGVADYAFAPGVISPTQPTHVAYVWNAATHVMRLYLNGKLAGETTGVSTSFAMPYGQGFLGATSGGAEPMGGKIYRVTVYDEILTDAALQRHAGAFTDVLRPPLIVGFTSSSSTIAAGDSVTLSWDVQNARSLTINGTDHSAVTQITVAPLVTTAYVLNAVNTSGNASAKVTVVVQPPLGAYDEAIAKDATNGLPPLIRQSSLLALSGAGGTAFNFGTNSGDASIEFIIEGDTSANTSSFLAVGENTTNSLRYYLYGSSGHLGFTRIAVADYDFTPFVPAPSWPTHVTYVWNAGALTMKLYVNGVLAGTTTNVAPEFGLPSGQGWLGANATSGETMSGTVFRVTSYDDILSDAAILRHANAFLSAARPGLFAYDTAIAQGEVTGAPTLARLLAPMRAAGAGGVSFNFGEGSGDQTFEFILEGNPDVDTTETLAVGTNTSSILRYECGDNSGQLGFTQIGVLDYLFNPGVPSPTQMTHVTYAWDAANTTVKLFTNGVLAGTTTGVDPSFVMPGGLGWLGGNPDAFQAMVGTIHRLNVFDTLLSDATILAHARTLLTTGQRPKVTIDLTGATPGITLSQGISGLHYRIEYRTSLDTASTWQTLQDIPALAGTSLRVIDPSPVAGGPRFYRAVQVQ
jgi:hypothetical protein